MTSLYRRATPPQRRVLRIVEGAVKNALDAHPRAAVPHNFARSVAKRATGTLTAQWPDVLAARMPSDRAGSDLVKARPVKSHLRQASQRGSSYLLRRTPPCPFKKLYTRLGAMAGFARKAGNEKRAAAFADALRVIANLEAESSIKNGN